LKILVTGATGFTAGHLIARLRREKGAVISGSDLAAAPAFPLDSYHACDITDASQVAELVRRTEPQWVFHLAGLFRGSAPVLYRVNVVGAVNLFEAVKNHASQAAVLAVGSAAEYGIWPPSEMPLAEDHPCRPAGPYGVSKHSMTLIAQDYARNEGLKAVVARPFNLVGAGMPATLMAGAIVQRIKSALAAGQSAIVVGNLEAQRDFVAIEDAVEAYVKLLQAGVWGQVVNVCSGRPSSIRSVIETLLSFAPKPMALVEDESLKRANDAPIATGDPARARQSCGFSPQITLQDALRSAWNAAMT
jgi:GDP-4-dehydro-6-deoxy-D-mannose reductase